VQHLLDKPAINYRGIKSISIDTAAVGGWRSGLGTTWEEMAKPS
jgi:hypothetical protein